MVDPETAVQMMRAESSEVLLHEAPAFIEDVDGAPLGLEPGRTVHGMLGPIALTADEWEATAYYLLRLLDAKNND